MTTKVVKNSLKVLGMYTYLTTVSFGTLGAAAALLFELPGPKGMYLSPVPRTIYGFFRGAVMGPFIPPVFMYDKIASFF